MIVFYNLVDIGAINAMTIWLCNNPNWQRRKYNARRLFLEELAQSLTHSHNERRLQQTGLTSKSKLALQSIGFEIQSKISTYERSSVRCIFTCGSQRTHKNLSCDKM